MMKHQLFSFLFSLLSLSLIALPSTEVRAYQNLRFPGTAVQSTAGDNWVFWEESPDLEYQIRAQRYDNQGIAYFPEPITIPSQEGSKRLMQVVPSSDNGIVLLYVHAIQADLPTYRLQKLNSDGEPVWQEYGIEVGEILCPESPFARICANALGGAFLVYVAHDPDQGRSFIGKNFDSSGSNLWSVMPEILVPMFQSVRQLLLTDEGDLLISLERSDLNYIRKVDNFGNSVGADPLLTLDSALPPGAMMTKAHNGNILFYTGINQSAGTALQLQMMDAQGNLLYSSMPELAVPGPIWQVLHVLPDQEGGFFLALETKSTPPGYSDILQVQHIDADLTPTWDAIQQVFSDDSDILDLDAKVDSADNLWLSFVSIATGHTSVKVLLLKLDSSGIPVFANQEISVNTRPKYQPKLLLDDKALLFWRDNFYDSISMRRQIVNSTGTLLLQESDSMLRSMLSGYATTYGVYSFEESSICLMHDFRGDNMQIYFQILDSSLNQQLQTNGKALNQNSRHQQELLSAKIGLNKHLGLLYCQYDGEEYSYYFQEIDDDGELIFPDEGIHIATVDFSSTACEISSDENSWYLYWADAETDNEIPNQVRGQRILDGQIQWPAGGKILASHENSYISAYSAADRYLVYYQVDYSGAGDQCIALRLQSDGNLQQGWSPQGVLIAEANPQNNSYVFMDKTGLINDDLYIFQIQTPTDNSNMDSSYLKLTKLTPDGCLPWGEDGLMMAESNLGDYAYPSNTLFGDEISILYTTEYNSYQNCYYLQKVDTQGNLLFGPDGVATPSSQAYMDKAQLVEYDNGCYSLFAREFTPNFILELTHSYLNANGSLQNSQIVSTNDIRYLYTVKSNNRAMLYWTQNEELDPFDWEETFRHSIHATLMPEPVSISDPTAEQTPALRLSQNTPNPFRDSTVLAYKLRECSPVKIQIFNIKGQLIQETQSSTKNPGDHEWIWNGKDSQGCICPTGVYFFRVTSGRYGSTKKMILIR
jgi:hypothetical protein